MPEISSQTLVIAIQAVAREVRLLRKAIATGDAGPDDDLLLDDRLQAADELEEAYDIAARSVINLPPYHQLAGD